MIFYMTLISTHIKRIPFFIVIKNLKENHFNLSKFNDDCFQGKITKVFELAPEILKTVDEKYKNASKVAIIKTTNSSLLYLKDKNITKINFDFLNAANLDKINLNNYDLVILEGEIQDDNVFNPEDVEINYIIQNEKIIFKKQKNKVQCCYNALNTNPNESISRNCLGYSYMKFLNQKLQK